MKTHATLPLSVAFALCLSAVACPGIACAATVNFDVEPTAVQNAAIRRALAADIKDFYHPEEDRWQVAQADLDDDGRPDLLVQYADSNFCGRSEEHTSELQSLMRISYAVFCLKKKKEKH